MSIFSKPTDFHIKTYCTPWRVVKTDHFGNPLFCVYTGFVFLTAKKEMDKLKKAFPQDRYKLIY